MPAQTTHPTSRHELNSGEVHGVKLRQKRPDEPGPRMNREQRRAFMKYLNTPEGKAAVERVKAEHVAKAKREAEAKCKECGDGSRVPCGLVCVQCGAAGRLE